jgi:2-oxo-4-hydroxy-4-carboxy-5-ureidoimidazoline decarboxylase
MSMPPNEVVAAWNEKAAEEAAAEILPCCGSRAWARGVAKRRPYRTEDALFAAADEVWWSLNEEDWLEAFACHPRIGAQIAPEVSTRFSKWSRQEQSLVGDSGGAVRLSIAEGNRKYEERFGFTYIVCATGKSAEEMLAILEHRLRNNPEAEMKEAAEQQRQITQLRLRKWLNS